MGRQFSVVDVQQRSPEWFAARIGRLTGSNADALFRAGKGKEESVQRRDLRIRLALERLTQTSQDDDGYVNAAMQRGIDREADARMAYEAATGRLVREAGFLSHNTLMVGTSLDGYCGDFDGVVELKCPKSATHLGYLRAETFPLDYLHQIRHHVWITGAAWAEFVSFDDRLPEDLQLAIHRVTREQLDIPGYAKAAEAFLAEVEAEVKAIESLRKGVAA